MIDCCSDVVPQPSTRESNCYFILNAKKKIEILPKVINGVWFMVTFQSKMEKNKKLL